jgi:hypothetical protein
MNSSAIDIGLDTSTDVAVVVEKFATDSTADTLITILSTINYERFLQNSWNAKKNGKLCRWISCSSSSPLVHCDEVGTILTARTVSSICSTY